MNCPDGYRVEEIKEGDTLSKIAKKEWGDGNLWREVILNPQDGQSFSEAESRRLQIGQLVCVQIKGYTPNAPFKLVSKKKTYFKSDTSITVAEKSDAEIRDLETQKVICTVSPNTVFRLREFPTKINRHWRINLLDLHNGKHEWYAFEEHFSEPQRIG